MPAHPQSSQTSSIDDYAIPFSKALLLLEELGTGAELAIEAAQISLFDLETPLSLLDDNSTEAARLEIPPARERVLQEGIATAVVFSPLHVPWLISYALSLISMLNVCSPFKSCLTMSPY